MSGQVTGWKMVLESEGASCRGGRVNGSKVQVPIFLLLFPEMPVDASLEDGGMLGMQVGLAAHVGIPCGKARWKAIRS
jgi:hypothetical protein